MFHSIIAVFLEIENLVESRILSGKCISFCGYELKFGLVNIHLFAFPTTFFQKRTFNTLSFFHLRLNNFKFQQNHFSSFTGHTDRNETNYTLKDL